MAAAHRRAVQNGDLAENGDRSGHPEIDWEAIERSSEFRELVSKKRAFVVPATVFFLTWYFGFIVLAGYAPDFMGREFIWDGLTVGYVLALSQFVMTWVLAAAYIRRADRVFDPLAERTVRMALEGGLAPQEQTQAEPARAPRAPTGEAVTQ